MESYSETASNMWTKLTGAMQAPIFGIGVFLGFLVCCALGRHVAGLNPYGNIARFPRALDFQTFYYPTISQMIAMAKEPLDQHKTLVLVGGNSIGVGVGEPESEIWTKHLQEILGSDYVVRNLAICAMPPANGAYFAFLSLSRNYDRIIYVPLWISPYFGFFEKSYNGYPYYWDAAYKGLLPAMPYAEKDIEVRQSILEGQLKNDSEETLLAAHLDSLFYFRDLWTTVGYKLFFTIWTPGDFRKVFGPRAAWVDDDYLKLLPVPQRFEKDSAHFLAWLKQTIGAFWGGDKGYDGTLIQGNLKFRMRSYVPDSVRDRILMVTVSACPFYVEKLSLDEQKRFRLQNEITQNMLQDAHLKSIVLGQDFTNEDYVDSEHLSSAGGNKLAEKVADAIRHMEIK